MSPLALQAHSIRAELAADWQGTLRRVAAMGYPALELTWPLLRVQQMAEAGPLRRWLARLGVGLVNRRGARRLAARLNDLSERLPLAERPAPPGKATYQGLHIPALHAPLPLGRYQQPVLQQAARLGVAYLVAALPAADFATAEAVQHTCDQLNAAARVAGQHGLRLAYHNHWWEFAPVQGRLPFEMMLAWLDPAVCFEVDVYWVQVAGHDPAAWLRRLADRAPLLHLKDGPATPEAPMTALGEGVMDIPALLAAASPGSWWIVELDRCATDMLTAVQQSYAFLQAHAGKTPMVPRAR